MSALEALLSVNETAAVLGVCTNTVRRIIQRGDLPSVAVGRRTMVEPCDLRAFVAARKALSNDAGPVAAEPVVRASADGDGGHDES